MTKILSEPSLHVEQDSAINLTCIMSVVQQNTQGVGSSYIGSEQNLPAVLWYKNKKVMCLSKLQVIRVDELDSQILGQEHATMHTYIKFCF